MNAEPHCTQSFQPADSGRSSWSNRGFTMASQILLMRGPVNPCFPCGYTTLSLGSTSAKCHWKNLEHIAERNINGRIEH